MGRDHPRRQPGGAGGRARRFGRRGAQSAPRGCPGSDWARPASCRRSQPSAGGGDRRAAGSAFAPLPPAQRSVGAAGAVTAFQRRGRRQRRVCPCKATAGACCAATGGAGRGAGRRGVLALTGACPAVGSAPPWGPPSVPSRPPTPPSAGHRRRAAVASRLQSCRQELVATTAAVAS